jgi:hypothetical protein
MADEAGQTSTMPSPPKESDGAGVVGQHLDYKPLPFAPEVLEVPPVHVDFLETYRTPAQEAAWSEPDFVEKPIPILKRPMPSEPEAEQRPYDPEPTFRTISVASGTDGLVADMRPYRRVVTVLSIGDAVQATLAFRSRYTGESMLVVWNSSLPVEVPVFSFQELYVRHDSGVDQVCSFLIEPRGKGR